MSLRNIYRELLECAIKQGYLSDNYYSGICYDLALLTNEIKEMKC